MAQNTAVVTQSLTATASGTTDFTSSGFGTPTAAIVIVSNANTGSNPQANGNISIGFWDGTSQACCSVTTTDASTDAATFRLNRTDYIAALVSNTSTWVAGYQASAITDGIRLTLAVDNTGALRYATVILISGVSAKVVSITPNATADGTQASSSLGFEPGAVLFTTTGFVGSTPNSGSTQTVEAILSFGAATADGTHRMQTWASKNAAAASELTALFSETRAVGQVFNGATNWTAEVTTWGADTFTLTTRDGGSGGDTVYALALGGTDLGAVLGTITTRTTTGTTDTTTTGIDPSAVLFAIGATDTPDTLKTDSHANSFSLGAASGSVQAGFGIVDEDAAGTTNNESSYSSTKPLHLRASASGTASTLIEAGVTLSTEKFTTDYTTVSTTARKGWFLALGSPAGGAYTLNLESGVYSLIGSDLTLVKNSILTLESGTYGITGTNATLVKGYFLETSAGSYSLTGSDATVLHSRLLDASSGTYTINGADATLTYTPTSGAYSLNAESGAYLLTGSDVTFTYSGSEVTLKAGSWIRYRIIT